MPILRVWHQRGRLPRAPYRLGQSPAWDLRAMADWIAANKRVETDEPPSR